MNQGDQSEDVERLSEFVGHFTVTSVPPARSATLRDLMTTPDTGAAISRSPEAPQAT